MYQNPLTTNGWLGGALSAAAFREMALSYMCVGRVKFASLEAKFSLSHSCFLSLSGRSSHMTEIFLTGALSLNSIINH